MQKHLFLGVEAIGQGAIDGGMELNYEMYKILIYGF